MFFSIMRVLHNTLPCTSNFIRLKSKFVKEHANTIEDRPNIKAIASPTMVRGLAFFKEESNMTVISKNLKDISPKEISTPGQNFAALVSQTEKSLSPDVRVKR